MKLKDVMDHAEGFVARAEVSTTKEQVLNEIRAFRNFIRDVLANYQIVKRPPKKADLQNKP